MARPNPVADYYDRNTRRFLLVGRTGRRYAIHRELWGPGVRSVPEAAGYVNRLVGDVVASRRPREPGPDRDPDPDPLTILDMGCGVGGTLFALAERFPRARLHGVTISPRQHRMARRLEARFGVSDRCRIERADFQTMNLDLGADVVLGIESFVHSEHPSRFLASAAAHLDRGGRLIIVDDFLARDETTLSSRARSHVQDFRTGWHARSLCTVEACVTSARTVGLGLVDDRDLTPFVRPGRRFRDALIARVSPIFGTLGLVRRPFFANMIGGNALQIGLKEGFLHYRMLVFERAEA